MLNDGGSKCCKSSVGRDGWWLTVVPRIVQQPSKHHSQPSSHHHYRSLFIWFVTKLRFIHVDWLFLISYLVASVLLKVSGLAVDTGWQHQERPYRHRCRGHWPCWYLVGAPVPGAPLQGSAWLGHERMMVKWWVSDGLTIILHYYCY